MEENKISLDTMIGMGKKKEIAGREYTILPVNICDMHYIMGENNKDEHNYLYFISNIKTQETFFYEKYSDFLIKKDELASVNQGF